MKKNILSAFALVSVLASIGHSQILIDTTAAVSLNFDNLNTNFGGAYNATGGATAFPTASDPTGTNATTIYSGTTNPGFVTNNDDYNPGGVYSTTSTYSNSNSYRALQNGASTDLAIGLKDSTDRTFTLRLQNSGVASAGSFNLSYNVEQYSTGASPTVISLSYSTDGTNFITTNLAGGGNVVATTTPTGGTDANLANVLSTNRTATITETIAQNSELYIRWTYDHQTGTSAHLGLDDITVSAVAVPEPSTYAMIAGGLGLMLVVSRRKARLSA